MATKQINLRLDVALLTSVDQRRGMVPRNAWITDVLQREIAACGEGDVLEAEDAGIKVGTPEPLPKPAQRPVRKHAPTCTCAVCKPVK